MHIHILGICGTFMGGLALLARAQGFEVSGTDENVYPPMSEQLIKAGIQLQEGYDSFELDASIDKVVIGNALSRGNPAIEKVLNSQVPYVSGPQWLYEEILHDKWVIAVAGTHGKTTTSSMCAWLLEQAGFSPGFLIGGVPNNFGFSAKMGATPFFVIEADEYDSAFFDKRPKFIHYRPRTCILNNLEFDHADIYDNLQAIQKQFHYLIRTVPSHGAIIANFDNNLQTVLKEGYWSKLITVGDKSCEWYATLQDDSGSHFNVYHQQKLMGQVKWKLMGLHNVQNALAALAAVQHVGIKPEIAIQGLNTFESVKRRLELKGNINQIKIYDDFAHHPTAIESTLQGLKAKVASERVIAVLDLRSNTMCLGTHEHTLADSLKFADLIWVYQSPKVKWDVMSALKSLKHKAFIAFNTQDLLEDMMSKLKPLDHVLIMSNGSFDKLHQRLMDALNQEVMI